MAEWAAGAELRGTIDSDGYFRGGTSTQTRGKAVAVYRKIPVAKQGDTDSRTQAAIAQLSQEAEAEAKALVVSDWTAAPKSFIPQGDAERKAAPMFRGLVGYFPAALFCVAAHSQKADQKHNPGNTTGPNWSRGKSSDHADCILRHLVDSGGGEINEADTEYHLTALAWRSLALLQEFKEKQGARPGVRSVLAT